MKKKIFILLVTSLFVNQFTKAQDNVTISVSESTLNRVIDLGHLSHLLSYSDWNRGSITKLIYDCSDRVEFKNQIFYHATLANTVTLDLLAGNSFRLNSTKKHTDGRDIFLEGGGSLKSPIAFPWNPHLMKVDVFATGTIGGNFSFEDGKLKLIFNDVDLSILAEAEGGLQCGSNYVFPIDSEFNPTWELDINLGTDLMPNALKGYFTEDSPVITSTSNEIRITYESIPFIEDELDSNFSAFAVYQVELSEIVQAKATNSVAIAGHAVLLRPGFEVKKGASFSAKIEPYDFGTETID